MPLSVKSFYCSFVAYKATLIFFNIIADMSKICKKYECFVTILMLIRKYNGRYKFIGDT